MTQLVKNAVGRLVPTEINGKKQLPFQGVGKYKPDANKVATPIRSVADYPADGDKRQESLKDALIKSGLKNGMTISTHHHFRNGDLIANQVFEIASELGIKGLVWYPSASFPCHEPMIKHLKSGVIHHIEGSMNGPLGRFTSHGNMKGTGILRSHGATESSRSRIIPSGL